MYFLCVWIHIVAAATWVGSMIFFAAVAAPVLRREEFRDRAPQLLRTMGARFRVLGWVSLGVLVATGVTNLVGRGIGWSLLTSQAFWATGFGHALACKLGLVALVVVGTFAHDLSAARHGKRPPEGGTASANRAVSRSRSAWLGRGLLVASLGVLFFAAALVRGLP